MRLLALALALLTGALFFLSPPGAAAQQPELIYIYPADGITVSSPPTVYRLCFEEPVDITDLHLGGDFRFTITTPDGMGLGSRTVFRRDGLGVDVYPGIPENASDGEWEFTWRVTDPESGEPLEGVLNVTVDPDGTPLPEEPPTFCGPEFNPDAVPTIVSEPSPTPEGDGETSGDGDDDSDTDWLLIAGIAVGAVAGVGAIGGIGYLIYRRSLRAPGPPAP